MPMLVGDFEIEPRTCWTRPPQLLRLFGYTGEDGLTALDSKLSSGFTCLWKSLNAASSTWAWLWTFVNDSSFRSECSFSYFCLISSFPLSYFLCSAAKLCDPSCFIAEFLSSKSSCILELGCMLLLNMVELSGLIIIEFLSVFLDASVRTTGENSFLFPAFICMNPSYWLFLLLWNCLSWPYFLSDCFF